ncbi:carboxymuconolactone decarboxylase family protein [Gemmatimonas sp. UBA7669]|uniref:carboxymuconolactone decarboxylase family protein n=1 Tax=Gemmatimonas sp. UBA7669 TaxID=1946568 RepID=UPI0025C3E825|nr:carboxymuconolactone decarboxylase family protein [Gemmatimonas sp. UBA7669]
MNARREDGMRDKTMTQGHAEQVTLPDAAARHTPLAVLDAETAELVRLAALLAGGSEGDIREALAGAAAQVRAEWVEEVILQTYLFAGFPRALNAAREWRRISGRSAPTVDAEAIDDPAERLAQGERTCATVYGRFYERLRVNIAELHPALDQWMIEEGYGKVLSRAPLDLARRELCIVAACAIARQDRQLHSHLHGALHAGASAAVVSDTLAVVAPLLDADDVRRYQGLWARVQGK